MPGRNPHTVEEARAFVAHVQSLFMPWDIEASSPALPRIASCVLATCPNSGARRRSKSCSAAAGSGKDYRLKKEFRALTGDTIANYWEGEWEDRVTGKQMAGRGVEVWEMRGGRIAVWEAAFNVNEVGRPSAMGLT